MKLPASAIETIERVRLGFAATITVDGKPSVSPKGTFIVVDKRTLAFGEIRSPQTLANLKAMPEVEVNFVDRFTRKGVRVRGQAGMLDRGTDGYAALIGAFRDIWSDLADRINTIVTISVDEVKPLSTPAYDDGATEEEMIALYKAKFAEMYP